MAKGKKTYSVHSVIALLAISLPLLVSFLKEENKPDLAGIVLAEEKPKLDLKNWLDASYQEGMEDYNNDRWAYKEVMVRLNNQFYYSAFNQLRVNQFVAGKENYVFAEASIDAYYGTDYIGEARVKECLRKCKVIQDSLQRKGITFLVAFAPGKAHGAPEFIEDKYKKPITNTNINSFSKESKRIGLNHIDFLEYYNSIKDTCKYPLYARFAHHWTTYFDGLASKKIISYVEQLRKEDLPDLKWDQVEISDTARGRDNDVLKSMNLYSSLEQNQKLGYPVFQIEGDSGKSKSRMLTIGDSYWYGIVFMSVPRYCFDNGQFWYYNKRVVPNPSETEKIESWQLDLKQSIESSKVVLIIASDPALPAFGWGFIENAYELYTNPNQYYKNLAITQQTKTNEKQIRETPLLLKKSTFNSKEKQISLDSAIKYDAMKMAGLIK